MKSTAKDIAPTAGIPSIPVAAGIMISIFATALTMMGKTIDSYRILNPANQKGAAAQRKCAAAPFAYPYRSGVRPDFFGNVTDETDLGPLFFFRENISFFR